MQSAIFKGHQAFMWTKSQLTQVVAFQRGSCCNAWFNSWISWCSLLFSRVGAGAIKYFNQKSTDEVCCFSRVTADAMIKKSADAIFCFQRASDYHMDKKSADKVCCFSKGQLLQCMVWFMNQLMQSAVFKSSNWCIAIFLAKNQLMKSAVFQKCQLMHWLK